MSVTKTNIRQGFTIVELLIVIVVIAILAAVSIVAFTGIQNRANDSVVQADARAIAKKLEAVKIETGSYPVAGAYFPAGLRITRGSYSTSYHNVMYCVNKATDKYALGLISKSQNAWVIVSGRVEAASPVNIHATACNAVGATWANDAVSGAVHGYNTSTGAWSTGWSLIE